MIADIVRCSGDMVDGFLDDRDASQFPGMRVLGSVDDALKIAQTPLKSDSLLELVRMRRGR